jgi:predicted alpha/beta-fold hydrolase
MLSHNDSLFTGGEVPPFEPHPLVRGGHAQTIAGRYLPGSSGRLKSTYHEVSLDDGDRLAILDSIPSTWKAGEPVVLLVHGLAGCARSPYVVRIASRLVERGWRAIRMNLRGAGSGFGAARGIYHGGRTEDLRAVTSWIAQHASQSPIALMGFSLGGNLVLKLAAEAANEPVKGLDCVIAANPPLDLAACCQHIQRPENRIYDKHFVRMLHREVGRLHQVFPDLGQSNLTDARSVFEFDEQYTAPRNGFASAQEYYELSSSAPLLEQILVPGLIIHAKDDPFIPPEPFETAKLGPNLTLELVPSGGHLGYVSRHRYGRDRRWLDARLVAWLARRWNLNTQDGSRT